MTAPKSRHASLHHKTAPVAGDDLPFNPANTLLALEDVNALLEENGLPPATEDALGAYRCAFVHSSYVLRKNQGFEEGNARMPPGCLPLQEMAYERLEYLGDAVLGCVVAEYLYNRFPGENEGFLTRLRTGIVNGAALADLASELGLERFVILSKQLEETGGRECPAVLEDAFEAFVGAVFTRGGYDAARTFLVRVMETWVDWAELVSQKPHPKERLARASPGVRYLEVNVERKGGKGATYTIAAKAADGRLLGTGKEASRRAAEKAAAVAALGYLAAAPRDR